MAIEQVKIEFMRSRANIYRVPAEQWRKWSVLARYVFNQVFSAMSGRQSKYTHPEQALASRRNWRTVCWNAAWEAADAATRA